MSQTQAPIALFYGSSTCYTEMAGEKIRAELGEELVDFFNINEIWDDINEVDFTGKKVALYGLGDQIGYPEWFLDAMGYLHSKVVARGAIPCGYWPNEGYTYEESKALTPDGTHFVGLALDEENEFAKTAERISLWCAQVREEFGI
jgi:flavodoxin II